MLTDLQINILKTLRYTPKEINDILPEEDQIVLEQNLHVLLAQKHIETQEGPDGPQYECSVRGRNELVAATESRRQAKAKASITPTRTHEHMTQNYVPPKTEYYRNAGNKHILSKGF